jgi:lysophospholipase III
MARKLTQLKCKFRECFNYFLNSQVSFAFRLDYKKSDDLSGTPELIYGDGDGTVNSRSLKGCTYWRGLQKQSITTLDIPKAEHFEILSNPQIVSYILDVLVN